MPVCKTGGFTTNGKSADGSVTYAPHHLFPLRLMVGRLTLNQQVEVRLLKREPVFPLSLRVGHLTLNQGVEVRVLTREPIIVTSQADQPARRFRSRRLIGQDTDLSSRKSGFEARRERHKMVPSSKGQVRPSFKREMLGSSPAGTTKRIGYKDPDKQKLYQADWFQRNKPKVVRKTKHTRTLLRDWLREVLSGLKCVMCGEDDYVALDLHHYDENTKLFQLSRAASTTTDRKKIVDEVEKCVALCANCHRKHHAGRAERQLTEKDKIKVINGKAV